MDVSAEPHSAREVIIKWLKTRLLGLKFSMEVLRFGDNHRATIFEVETSPRVQLLVEEHYLNAGINMHVPGVARVVVTSRDPAFVISEFQAECLARSHHSSESLFGRFKPDPSKILPTAIESERNHHE